MTANDLKLWPGYVSKLGREFLTHWAAAGLIIALTGLAPEHWLADLFHRLAVPDSFWRGWAGGADIRTVLVAVGVAIIGWDVVRRTRGEKDRASGTAATERPEPGSAALALPDKPSIAVLPFQNMTGEAEQEYFTDGMVDEIITALCRFQHLFVIARNSSFTYKNRAVDLRQVGRELGVRYVLEGSVRKATNHVRITGQLIDAATGIHIWADRFDSSLDDIFDLQDQIVSSVVGAITPKLEQAEIDRARRKPTEKLDAYDYYLRGMACLYQLNAKAQSDALGLFSKAIEKDPNFATAYGMAAWCHAQRKSNGWVVDPKRETAEATQLARRAVDLGQDDAVALSSGGFALVYVAGDIDGAAFVDRALEVNPNLASAWYFSGRLRVWLGEPDLAIEHLARAMRLSPLDPYMFAFQHTVGLAHFFAGRYDEALAWTKKALRVRPNFVASLRLVAASHALLGQSEEAQAAMSKLRQLDPSLRLSNLKNYQPVTRSEDFARYAEGLRRAGLPD